MNVQVKIEGQPTIRCASKRRFILVGKIPVADKPAVWKRSDSLATLEKQVGYGDYSRIEGAWIMDTSTNPATLVRKVR